MMFPYTRLSIVKLPFGTIQQQEKGVDAIIRPSTQITGHHEVTLLDPRFLPVFVNSLDTLHHQLSEGVKSTVFRTLGILASPMVFSSALCHTLKNLDVLFLGLLVLKLPLGDFLHTAAQVKVLVVELYFQFSLHNDAGSRAQPCGIIRFEV